MSCDYFEHRNIYRVLLDLKSQKRFRNGSVNSMRAYPHAHLSFFFFFSFLKPKKAQQQQHFISPHNIQEIKIYNNSTDDNRGAGCPK